MYPSPRGWPQACAPRAPASATPPLPRPKPHPERHVSKRCDCRVEHHPARRESGTRYSREQPAPGTASSSASSGYGSAAPPEASRPLRDLCPLRACPFPFCGGAVCEGAARGAERRGTARASRPGSPRMTRCSTVTVLGPPSPRRRSSASTSAALARDNRPPSARFSARTSLGCAGCAACRKQAIAAL